MDLKSVGQRTIFGFKFSEFPFPFHSQVHYCQYDSCLILQTDKYVTIMFCGNHRIICEYTLCKYVCKLGCMYIQLYIERCAIMQNCCVNMNTQPVYALCCFMLVYCMYAGNVGCTINLILNMLLCDIVFQIYNNQTVEICYIVHTT